MKEPILIVHGSASPHDNKKIVSENLALDQWIAALKTANFAPLVIGNAERGFKPETIIDTLRGNAKIKTVMLTAHGNIENDRHYILCAPDHRIWMDSLYDHLGRAIKRPLNLFLNSCGAGGSSLNAVQSLPAGSTLFTQCGAENSDSYTVDAASFRIPRNGTRNAAEAFFLNMLCNGMAGLPSQPHILTADRNWEGASHIDANLWIKGCYDILDPTVPMFSPEQQEVVFNLLGPYCEQGRLEQAMDTIELLNRTNMYHTYKSNKLTPVGISLSIDDEHFHKQCAEHDMLGPICAIGYILERETIGAFQTWEPQRYRKQPKSRVKKSELA